MFWKQANWIGSITTLVIGSILGGLRLLLEILYVNQQLTGFAAFFIKINFLHFCALLFAICCVIMVVSSLSYARYRRRSIAYSQMTDTDELEEKKEEEVVEETPLVEDPSAQKKRELFRKVTLTLALILAVRISPFLLWLFFFF